MVATGAMPARDHLLAVLPRKDAAGLRSGICFTQRMMFTRLIGLLPNPAVLVGGVRDGTVGWWANPHQGSIPAKSVKSLTG